MCSFLSDVLFGPLYPMRAARAGDIIDDQKKMCEFAVHSPEGQKIWMRDHTDIQIHDMCVLFTWLTLFCRYTKRIFRRVPHLCTTHLRTHTHFHSFNRRISTVTPSTDCLRGQSAVGITRSFLPTRGATTAAIFLILHNGLSLYPPVESRRVLTFFPAGRRLNTKPTSQVRACQGAEVLFQRHRGVMCVCTHISAVFFQKRKQHGSAHRPNFCDQTSGSGQTSFRLPPSDRRIVHRLSLLLSGSMT